MLPIRAYIPSRMLIRALSRPLPPQCHLTRAIPLQYRNARSKTTKSKGAARDKPTSKEFEQFKKQFVKVNDDSIDVKLPGNQKYSFDTREQTMQAAAERDLTDQEIMDPDTPVVEFYERDLDKGGPDILVKRIATPEDRAKHREMWKMLKEDDENPDYDDAHLRRAMVDEMLVDPRYKEFADVLKGMKERIMTKGEMAEVTKEALEEMDREAKEAQAAIKTGGTERLIELVNDPSFEHLQPLILEFQEKLLEHGNDLDHPEVMEISQKLEHELSIDPDIMEQLQSMEDDMNVSEGDDAKLARSEAEEDIENDNQLLLQMKDLLAAMGGNKSVETEIEQLLNEKVDLDEKESKDMPEFNPESLSNELTKLSKTPKTPTDASELMDPGLEARIDKILADPELLQKLSHLQKSIEYANERKAAGITEIPHEMAPDPEKLPAERTTGLQQRMEMARNDPEHAAALTSLHVNLPPPFHISPALKLFNQAIELAYLGANDDIRRILWRAYIKARTLPTFLQNVSDDTWDLIYYSQAVTWESNQNRQAHLMMLLEDLASVGKDGPPTHPSTFMNNQ